MKFCPMLSFVLNQVLVSIGREIQNIDRRVLEAQTIRRTNQTCLDTATSVRKDLEDPVTQHPQSWITCPADFPHLMTKETFRLQILVWDIEMEH